MNSAPKVRGLILVVSGLVPLLMLCLLATVVNPGRVVGNMLVAIAFLAMATLFLIGTVVIVTDKGYSPAIGVALGLFAPLGTIIAVVLEDKNRRNSIEPAKPVQESDLSAIDESKGSYDEVRWFVISHTIAIAVVFGLAHFVVCAVDMFRYNDGIASLKVLICAMLGTTTGVTLWGMAVMLTVTVAPQKWLLNSDNGKKWMDRTGLKNQTSTILLRGMTAFIAMVCGGWIVLTIVAVVSILAPDMF